MTIFSFYICVQPGIESLPMAEPTAGWSRWPRHNLWPAHIKMMLATLDCLLPSQYLQPVFQSHLNSSAVGACPLLSMRKGGERERSTDHAVERLADHVSSSPGLEPTISFKSDQSCFDLVFSWEILPTVLSLLRAQTRDSCNHNHSHSISWQ